MSFSFRPWLEQAGRDLKAAEQSFYDGDIRYCALLSRAATEKALWAYYVRLTGELPKEKKSVAELISMLQLKELEGLISQWNGELAGLSPDERSLKLSRKIVDWISWKMQ